MIRRVVLAVVAGIVAFLVCILLGMLLTSIGISWVAAIGAFLEQWAALIGLLVALWHFFSGGSWTWPKSE